MKLKQLAAALAGLGPILSYDQLVRAGLVVRDSAGDEVRALLSRISDQVKETGEKALAEASRGIQLSTANAQKVDELLIKQGELQARLLEVEQRAARTVAEANVILSAGHTLINDDGFKAWVQAGGMKSHSSGFVMGVNAALTSLGQPTTNTTTVGVNPQMQPGIVYLPERRMTVRDLLTPGRTTSNLIQYVRETGFTNAARTVSETTAKPESSLTYDLEQSAVVTIAHWIKASKQILDDFAQLQSNIDGRLRYGLSLTEEAQLLKGSGVGNNLNGVYTQATAYVAPIVIASPTLIDTIRLMLLQAELAEYPSTGIVLHPSDWGKIELTKTTDGAYLFANPQSLAQPALWGRPVVATQAMTQDTALVGAFRLGAQVFDREDANVVISSENQDDFIKNMITIRAEERLGLAVYRPEAFVKNTNLDGV